MLPCRSSCCASAVRAPRHSRRSNTWDSRAARPTILGSSRGGEQQRVALARAFVARPGVLFADEPTGNLDSLTGANIIERLFNLNTEANTTLVLVTHDAELAARCARMVRMDAGRVI